MRAIIRESIVFAVSVMAVACGGDVAGEPLAPTSEALSRAGGRVSLPFRGTITTADRGEIVVPNVVIRGTAEGTATHLGRYTATFVAVAPLEGNTGAGEYRFTAANGDQFVATFAGTATPDGSGNLIFTEVLTIVGGTGRFASATGTFTMIKTILLDEQAGSSTGTGSFEGRIELNK